MLARAFAAGVKADWVVADTVYGYDEMRDWLESQHQKYVRLEPISGGQRQIMLHWVPATICFKKHFLF